MWVAKIFQLFVRALIRPFLVALERELEWKPPRKWDLSDEVRQKLEQVTKEQVEFALRDDLAQQLHGAQVKIKLLQTEVASMGQGINQYVKRTTRIMQAVNNLDSRIKGLERDITALDRARRVERKMEWERRAPASAETEQIEWE